MINQLWKTGVVAGEAWTRILLLKASPADVLADMRAGFLFSVHYSRVFRDNGVL